MREGSSTSGATVTDALALRGICVVAHDDAWVAIDKPAGLPSVPGRKPELADCAWLRVQQHVGDALVVHRLDMATSGLLLFGRGAATQRVLSHAFATRQVHKTYVAQVHGHVRDDRGEIDLPLAADWPNRPRQVVDRLHGKAALTRYRVLSRSALGANVEHSVLSLEPVTGRTHQLRVHLAALGHAVVGDALYGPTIPASQHNDVHAQARMQLHALKIELMHPLTGLPLSLQTKEPPWLINT